MSRFSDVTLDDALVAQADMNVERIQRFVDVCPTQLHALTTAADRWWGEGRLSTTAPDRRASLMTDLLDAAKALVKGKEGAHATKPIPRGIHDAIVAELDKGGNCVLDTLSKLAYELKFTKAK